MGDDVEIEEIFDTDLLSGSEDEEGAHEEEALLGVDAVSDEFIFPSFYVLLQVGNSDASISRSLHLCAGRVTCWVLLRGSTTWTLMGSVTASIPGTPTLRMRGSRRGGRRKDR